ncbi:TcpE family conjugal transfer membrane protein [Sphaerisporangium sp. TRM90804]|uniref:TcpE family conjugal transfer membrane protein n=1 Tax=Sphaerisporangium sp. TRM90804 TaxID=3031113 RepID=UPI00244D4B1E|nr:TcpE family conjugal transfer membrane protein [Sphaerisporangium sp. TRM90804]MDH2428868.1 TcpE family conjugal transfer membrane protein [Sphaerisporangium sp. TRM90804]
MDLPTYTNIWRIEKRLYKLYDLRLPMPLPIVWIGVFVGVLVPWSLLLRVVGVPFDAPWHVFYLVPPGLVTWLATRPVIESKRLNELLQSQLRYVGEPRAWCRLAPVEEPDEITFTARVWRAAPGTAAVAAADEFALASAAKARRGARAKPKHTAPRRRPLEAWASRQPASVKPSVRPGEVRPVVAAAAAAVTTLAPPERPARLPERRLARGTATAESAVGLPAALPLPGEIPTLARPAPGARPAISPPAVAPPVAEPPAAMPPEVAARAVLPPAVTPPAVAPPTVAPGAVLPPAVAPPTVMPRAAESPAVASRSVMPPAVALPTVAPGAVTSRAVSPHTVMPPEVESPAVVSRAVLPPAVSPPAVAPPAVTRPSATSPAAGPPASSPPAVTPPVAASPGVTSSGMSSTPAPASPSQAPAPSAAGSPPGAPIGTEALRRLRRLAASAEAPRPTARPARAQSASGGYGEAGRPAAPERASTPSETPKAPEREVEVREQHRKGQPPRAGAPVRSPEARTVWPTARTASEARPPSPEPQGAEAERQPSLPERQPSLPERQSSVVPGRQSSVPERQPSLPERQSSVPERQPSLPERQPSVPERQPSPPERQPSRPETRPAAPERAPSRPAAQPSWPEQAPTRREAEPARPERGPSRPEALPSVGAPAPRQGAPRGPLRPAARETAGPLSIRKMPGGSGATADPAAPSVPVPVPRPGDEPRVRRVESVVGRDQTGGWRRLAQVVVGGGAPTRHDGIVADEVRAATEFTGSRRVMVLGCTGGAGQTTTALMLGHTFARHRDDRVLAVDANTGDNTMTDRIDAESPESLTSLLAGLDGVSGYLSMRTYTTRCDSGLEVVGSDSDAAAARRLADRGLFSDQRLAQAMRVLDRHYSVILVDPAASVAARMLPYADQLILVAPASEDAPEAVAMTFDWLDGHGSNALRQRAIMVINGVSRRSMGGVEQAEAVARGRCRAIVRVPWDDELAPGQPGPADPAHLRAQGRRAYVALAGVVASGLAAASRPSEEEVAQ